MAQHKIQKCRESWRHRKISFRHQSFSKYDLNICRIFKWISAHTHMSTQTHTDSTHTQGLNPSEKRMAQESPGHNASLHPLISAERTERRRKKGENRELERAKKKRRRRKREKMERVIGKCTERALKKIADKTRKGNKEMKESKKERRRKQNRRITRWRREKEKHMFASHLQWRRTA